MLRECRRVDVGVVGGVDSEVETVQDLKFMEYIKEAVYLTDRNEYLNI